MNPTRQINNLNYDIIIFCMIAFGAGLSPELFGVNALVMCVYLTLGCMCQMHWEMLLRHYRSGSVTQQPMFILKCRMRGNIYYANPKYIFNIFYSVLMNALVYLVGCA